MLPQKVQDDFRQITVVEEAIQQNEKLFCQKADAAPVMIWMAGSNTLCYYFNSAWLQFRGRSLNQEIGYLWLAGVHPGDRQRCQDIYLTAFEKHNSFQRQYRLQGEDGEYRWILDTAVPRFAADNSFVGYVGYCVDITDNQVKKASDKQSDARLRLALQVAQINVWDWEVATGKVIWVHGGDTLFGTKAEVDTYEAFLNQIHPQDRNLVMEAIALSLVTGSEYNINFRLVGGDGTVRWVQGKGDVLQDNTGTVRMMSTIIDITERRESEQALMLTQQRLQHLLRSSPAIIYSCKATGDRRITFFSENITEILGYEMSECLEDSKFWIDRVHPEDAQQIFSGVSKLFENGHDIHEYRFRHKDGNYRWMRDQAKLVKDDYGNLIEIVGSWVDISERKVAEIALQVANQELENRVEERTTELTNTLQQLQAEIKERLQTEEELRQKTSELEAIFQALPDLYFLLDNDKSILDYKIANVENLYVPPNVFLGKQMQEVLPPVVGERFQAAITEVLQTKSLVSFEYTLPMPQGEVDYEARLVLLQDRKIIIVIRDISKRKAAEKQLLLYAKAIESSSDAIGMADITGKVIYHNPALNDLFEYTVEELNKAGGPPALYVNQAEAQTVFKSIQSGQSWNGELTMKSRSGRLMQMSLRADAIKDSKGKIIGLIGIYTDISDRKQEEEALRERARLAAFRADVNAALTKSDTLQGIMHGCTEALVHHVDAAFARIWTLNKHKNVLELQVSSGMYTHIDGPHKSVPVGQFKIGLIAEEGKPRLTNSVLTDPRVGDKEWAKREGMVAFAGYPLIVEGDTLGVIAMFSRKVLSESTLTALEFAADEIAIGIKRKQADEALQKSEIKFRELAQREALLNSLSSQIRASLDINSIMQTAVTEIRNLLQIDRCTFLESHNDAQTPYWKVIQEARNPALPSIVGLQVTHAEVKSISEKVLNKEIFTVDDVQALPDLALREMLLSFGHTATLTLPIHSQSGEIGLLCCTNCTGERHWRDTEVELLLAVADQLVIAIDQAKLYKQSRTAAQTAQEKAIQLQEAMRELSSTQAQLIQTEKMSSLGQLVAGVAHEINNPVSFIYGNLTHASEYTQDLLRLIELYQQHYTSPVPEIQKEIQAIDLDFLQEDLPKLLDSMMIGADRISQIVLSLRNFSRLDQADMKPVDIHEGIDNTLLLLQNRLKPLPKQPQIQIIKEYGNLPPVECYAGQLNQVFINILTNAIDVLQSLVNSPEQKTNLQIRIRTEILNNEQVLIRIADNGPGMTEEIRKRIFDPFFTTKPVGKGTGMGLSISYQIVVEKHRGEFECISAPGQGAEFVIAIPLQQQQFS